MLKGPNVKQQPFSPPKGRLPKFYKSVMILSSYFRVEKGATNRAETAEIHAATSSGDGECWLMEYQRRIEPMLDETGQSAVFAPLCRSIIMGRALLAEMFGPLCSDPGSEMLLDLYWRESQGLKTSLTSLWLASKASEMTARGCLAVMEAQAIVERRPDPTDKRRTHVRLTAAGREKMDTLFRSLLSGYAETCSDCARNCEGEDHLNGPKIGIPFCMTVDNPNAIHCRNLK